MDNSLQRHFFEEFTKYPRDGALHELLENTLVVQVLNNRAERRMKVSLLFETYPDKSVRQQLQQAIQEAYSLQEVRVTACCRTDEIGPYLGELMEEVQAEIPVLSGYCEGSAAYDGGVLKVRTVFSGGAILQGMQCDKRIASYIKMKFGAEVPVVFEDMEEQAVDYAEYERRMREKLMQERPAPASAPAARRRRAEPQKPVAQALYGREIKSDPVEIATVDVLMGRATVSGVVDELRTVELKNGAGIMLLFRLEDKTSMIGVKVFPGEKTGLLLSALHNGDRVIIRGAVEDDRFAGDVVIRASSIGKLPDERHADLAPEKRVELRAHTNYSFTSGLIPPETLVDRAADWGHAAVAVTDRMSVQALPFAYARAKERGIKLVCGVDANYINDTQSAVFGKDSAGFDGRFVVFDIETTGLSPAVDRITEIGAVAVENGAVTDTFQTFVNPGMPIPQKIVALTGITDEMVAGAPGESAAVAAFLEFAGNAPLVAHNANFDCGFIRIAARRAELPFENTYIDTVPVCRSLFPELKSVKLDLVAAHLGLGRFNHHRADEDARVLAGIFTALLARLSSARGIDDISQINPLINSSAAGRPNQITILVRNETGLKNLYALLTEAYRAEGRVPAITRSMLDKRREGLLIGSGNMDGELIKMIVEGRSDADISRAAKFYDYLELQPISCAMRRVDTGWIRDIRQLQMLYEQVLELGQRQDKPVVATGDVCFMDEDELLQWDVLCAARSQRGGRDPLFFRTTDEMLDEFAFLGEHRAVDVVIDNPARLAEMCGDIAPVRPSRAPEPAGEFQRLRGAVLYSAGRYYGEPYPEPVRNRLEQELTAIRDAGMSSALRIAYTAAEKLGNAKGTGWLGLSLCAYLLGVSDYDPLPEIPPAAHAAADGAAECPGFAGLAERAPGGGLLPAVSQEGVPVPFAWFRCALDAARGGVCLSAAPDADGALYEAAACALGDASGRRLLRGSRTQPLPVATARAYVRRYEEERNTALREVVGARVAAALAKGYRAAEYDRQTVLADLGEEPDLPLLPLQNFQAEQAALPYSHLTSDGLQSGYMRVSLCEDAALSALRLLERETGVSCAAISFSDPAVYDYIREAGASQEELFRMIPLLSSRAQLEAAASLEGTSFAQFVRIFAMECGDGPDAQPRALERAAASYRLLWFRLHEPGAFFGAYFSACAGELDYDLLQNPGSVERVLRSRAAADDGALSAADEPYRVALDLYRQGLSIRPVDLLASHPVLFLQKEDGLLLPLRSLTALGKREIAAIAGARRAGEDSAEALARRAGLSRPAMEALREKGILADTEDDGQLSLF